jgi:hypothetical protein
MSDLPPTVESTVPTPSVQAPRPSGFVLIAGASLLMALLLETAGENLWRASPLRWWTLIAVGVWALAMAAGRRVIGWRGRLTGTVVVLLGLVAAASFRVGAETTPGFHVASLALGRVIAFIAAAGVTFACVALLSLPGARKRWWLMLVAACAGLYSLIPIVVALVRDIPLSRAVRGEGLWTLPPFWLQGVYVAAELVIPVGLVLAVAMLVRPLLGGQRMSRQFAGSSAIVIFGALVLLSVELSRAGVPHLARAAVDPLIAPGGPSVVTAGLPGTVEPPASGEATTVASRPGEAAPVTSAPGEATPVMSAQAEAAAPRSVAEAASASVTTKAIELRVEGYQATDTIDNRHARPGYTFVIVDTSWKNVIPLTLVEHKAPDRTSGAGGIGFGTSKSESAGPPGPPPTLESTPYVVLDVKKHLWLLSDGRFSDPVDLEATSATPGHLSAPKFTVAKLGEVLRGKIVFEAPAGAVVQALQFLDTKYGHALISVKGPKSASPPPPMRPAKRNTVVELAVTEASWSATDRPAPPGLRYYTLGLRGSSQSPTDIVELKFNDYAFLQNDQGCVAQPETDVSWLARPFAKLASFLPTAPNEGQLAFLVPSDTKSVRFLLRPVKGGALDLNVDDNFPPSWPAAARTIQDGSTMRVLVLPTPNRPATLPPAPAGREQVLLDVIIENLKPTQGIEFDGNQQLRLVDAAGGFHQPDPVSAQVPCRLTGEGVVPAGGSRRFMLVYAVPSGQSWRLEYRGFEKNETIDLK